MPRSGCGSERAHAAAVNPILLVRRLSTLCPVQEASTVLGEVRLCGRQPGIRIPK